MQSIAKIGQASRGLAAIALIFAVGRAEAVCIPRAAPEIDSPKAYIFAFYDSLVVLKAASHLGIEITNAKSPMDGIAAFETARQEFNCMISYVAPYEKSSNKSIATSAEGLSEVATSLQHVFEAERQKYKDLLDGKTQKPSEDAERAGKLEVEAKEAWHLQMDATVAALFGLIEFDAAQKQRLILTSSERDSLVQRLEKKFGVLPNANGNLPPLENSVAVLLDVLTDKGRKTHDAV
jgi:hypothetical protein